MNKHIELLKQLYKWNWDRLYSFEPYGENYIKNKIYLYLKYYE